MSDVSSLPSRPTSPVGSILPDNLHTARPYRFTWDPATRRPGPESVSGTTEGRGDYFGHQPVLGFLNTSTTNLGSAALPTEWSSSKHGFHAISTVLNNPHKRQAPPKAHSTLPTVPVTDLPRVRRKDFDSYLRAIGPEWERFERNAQLGREGQAQIMHQPDLATLNGDNVATPRASLASDAGALRSAVLQGKAIPSLDTVPAVFFEKQFNLADPRTFDRVTEQDGRGPSSEYNDPLSLSHSLPLFEKFSHYADTVEQHLVREISLRSTSFFAALTNLHDLQSESEHCLDRIGRLRTLLREVDEKQARQGLEVVRQECRLANVNRVQEGVKMVTGVVEMTGVARGLVNAGQWGEALGVIEDIEKLWEQAGGEEEEDVKTPRPRVERKGSSLASAQRHQNGNGRMSPLPPTLEEGHDHLHPQTKPPPRKPTFPLSSLRAFSALPSHLRALTMEIASSLSSELVTVLKSDLQARIGGTVENKGGEGLRDLLKPILQGLVRTKGLKEGMLTWREVVLGEVRGVIKQRLPEFDPSAEEEQQQNGRKAEGAEGRAGLANHLRNMPQQDFMVLIQSIYRSLLNGVEGLNTQGAIIKDVLQSIKSQNRSTSPSNSSPPTVEIPAIEEELSDILSSAAELSNTQAAKVISYRAEQHAALELPEFLAFFNDSWAFVVKCEVICGRMIVGLRGTVISQAKVFLQTFHQERISRSAKLVEDEQWNPAEVSPSLQHIANILIDSAVRDSPELIIKSDETIFSPPTSASIGSASSVNGPPSALPSSFAAALSHATSGTGSSANGSSASTKHLRIEDRTYFLVSATAEVLVLLLDYLRVVVNLSLLTTDTMSRVIEFLKAFNSRTCQVVLGAGAMRSAGLKNITAKHLALASQSLSIVFELIPYVRETFRRHLNQKQAVMLVEFDKLKRDYQEHQNEIHAKLIAIMGDRLSAHIKTLQYVDWNVPKPDGGVNTYMEILVKETVTLHKVLSRYLAAPVVEYVMTQVFAAINHRLSEAYGKIDLPHQEAKTRLLADAKYMHQKLAALRNVGTPTSMLETVIAEKSIPRPNNAPTPTRSNTLSANQRLKGLLSGRSAAVDKALPVPTRTPTPPVAPPTPEKSKSPASSTTVSSANGSGLGTGVSTSASASESTLALSTPPIEEARSSLSVENGGFKQVESRSPSPNPEHLSRGTPDNASEGTGNLPPPQSEGTKADHAD